MTLTRDLRQVNRFGFFIALIAVSLLACGVRAEPNKIAEDSGVDVGIEAKNEQALDNSAGAQSLSRSDWNRYFTEPNVRPSEETVRLRKDVVRRGNLSVGPSFNYRPQQDFGQNSRFDELRGPDRGIEAGAFAEYYIEDKEHAGSTVGFNFGLSGDVSKAKDGLLLSPEIYYTRPIGSSWQLGANVNSSFATEKLGGLNLGTVSNSPTTAGVSESTADSGFKDVGIGVGVTYNLAPSWNIDSALRYNMALGNAEDSPASEDEGSGNQLFGGVMVRFEF